MQCSDTTGEMPAIQCKHMDTHEAGMIEKFIEFFIKTCEGNGRLLLNITGGKIQSFEPTSKVNNKAGTRPNKKTA